MLQSEVTIDSINKIIDKILNSSNAFELLSITFDLVNSESSVKSNILKMLQLLNSNLHKMVFKKLNLQIMFDENFLNCLKNNIEKFIICMMETKSKELISKQIVMLSLACIYFRNGFMTEVFHRLMNKHHQKIKITNYKQIKINNLINKLIHTLSASKKIEMEACIGKTLELIIYKTAEYWANLNLIIEQRQLKTISIDKLFDFIKKAEISEILNIYYMIKISEKQLLLDKNKIQHSDQLAFCKILLNVYFELIENLKYSNEFLIVEIECICLLQKIFDKLSNLTKLQNIIFVLIFKYLTGKAYLFDEYNLIKIPKPKKSLLLTTKIDNEKSMDQKVENKMNKINKLLVITLINKCMKNEELFINNYLNSLLEGKDFVYKVSL